MSLFRILHRDGRLNNTQKDLLCHFAVHPNIVHITCQWVDWDMWYENVLRCSWSHQIPTSMRTRSPQFCIFPWSEVQELALSKIHPSQRFDWPSPVPFNCSLVRGHGLLGIISIFTPCRSPNTDHISTTGSLIWIQKPCIRGEGAKSH
jgi:hypothetical protein